MRREGGGVMGHPGDCLLSTVHGRDVFVQSLRRDISCRSLFVFPGLSAPLFALPSSSLLLPTTSRCKKSVLSPGQET